MYKFYHRSTTPLNLQCPAVSDVFDMFAHDQAFLFSRTADSIMVELLFFFSFWFMIFEAYSTGQKVPPKAATIIHVITFSFLGGARIMVEYFISRKRGLINRLRDSGITNGCSDSTTAEMAK